MEKVEHGGNVYGHPHVRLDFSVNTNPLGMPESVRVALLRHVDEFARYPDPLCRTLRSAIALHEEVPEDWILCGNGAADLIYRLCEALRPKRALVCAPAFAEYERALLQAGCEVARHILKEENAFALTEEMDTRTDMLFLCNPNNPTGRLIASEILEGILKKAAQNQTVVVVDECFLDFTEGVSAKQYLERMPGLVILKAFTKIYAMAGLRLGYMLCTDEGLLQKTSAFGQCWSVSGPAQIAGVAALQEKGFVERTRRLIAEERNFLSESLRALPVTVYKSDANFLLLRSEKPLYAAMLQRGILVRSCANFVGLDSTYTRIGIKTRAENAELVHALQEVLWQKQS